jgi:hypothetical protein
VFSPVVVRDVTCSVLLWFVTLRVQSCCGSLRYVFSSVVVHDVTRFILIAYCNCLEKLRVLFADESSFT